MVKYAVSNNVIDMPPELVDSTVAGIIEQAKAFAPKLKLTHTAIEDIIVIRHKVRTKNKRFCLLTRIKPTTYKQTDLDYLNELRAANGKVLLSNWFSGPAALAMAISSEQGKPINQAKEIEMILTGKIPKIQRLKPGVARGAYRTKEQAKQSTNRTPHSKALKKRDLPTTRVVMGGENLQQRAKITSAATLLKELGIDPKKGRAMLRKAGVDRNDYLGIRKFFEEKRK